MTDSKRKKANSKPRSSPSRMAEHRERLSSAMTAALDQDVLRVEVDDNDEELRRQAAIAARRSQKIAQERAASAIGAKFADPREDPEQLQDDIDELRRRIFLLDAEIQDLVASASMRFPTPSEVASVSAAVGLLEARVVASVAASALMAAASAVLGAWPA